MMIRRTTKIPESVKERADGLASEHADQIPEPAQQYRHARSQAVCEYLASEDPISEWDGILDPKDLAHWALTGEES